MVRVSFAIYDLQTGFGIKTPVACTLDGINLSTVNGIAVVDGITQGLHDFSIAVPQGYLFYSGEASNGDPLGVSGTIDINLLGGPWPEDPSQAFTLLITLEPDVVEPPPNGNGEPSSIGKVAVVVGIYFVGRALRWW